MDVSFGGIQTNLKQKYDTKLYSTEDLAYSLQETVFAMLVEVAERAMAHCGKQELVLGGGEWRATSDCRICVISCVEKETRHFLYLTANS